MSTDNLNPQSLAHRFQDFNQRLIAFVEQCPADKWRRVTKAEGWPVGVTAHHVGAIHYPVLAWVQMIWSKARPPQPSRWPMLTR